MGNRTVIRAFKDAEAYMDDIYALYRSLYDLPELQHEEQLSDRYLFNYCADRRYFVNILPYTKNRQVLLTPTFQGDSLGWRIIGGAVQASFDEAFVTVCQRHVERYVKSVDLGEIEPVAFLKNRFRFGAKVHDHLGILFVARVRNYDNRSLMDSLPASRGHFVPFDIEGAAPRLDEIYQKPAFELGVAVADTALQFVNQDHEIDTNQMYRGRYKFHDHIVKPLMKTGSKIFGEISITGFEAQVKREILEPNPTSVFDIACGENRSLVNLVTRQEASTFVGNDISWSQIELVTGGFSADTFRNNQGIVFFTNHDGRRLPFADKVFDVGVCKNVLHHMPDRRSATALLRELKRVSRKALIVEVMDPKFEGGRWPRLRHSYYIDFLKDAGGNFLSGDEFNSLIEEFSPKKRYDIRTLRGVYQFAVFEDDA